jgi:hypothetical protein
VGGRQGGAADEHRHHGGAPFQGSGQLAAYVVGGLPQPQLAVRVCGPEPARADHRQHGVARVESLVDRVREVAAGLDVGDVLEHVARAEPPGQGVAEPTRVAAHVGPPVAQEDPHHPSSRPPDGHTAAGLLQMPAAVTLAPGRAWRYS